MSTWGQSWDDSWASSWTQDQPAGAMRGNAFISIAAQGTLTSEGQPDKKPEYVVGGISWQQKRDAELLEYDEEALMIALIAQHQELICLHI